MKAVKKRILCILLLLICTFSVPITTYAYDWNADHPEVNTGSDVQEVKATVWNALRSEGYSEQSTASIMGNIYAESGYNVNSIERGRSWSYECYSNDRIGLGICQWSSTGRKDLLGSVCDENGVQWTDLISQVQTLVLELEDPYWISLSQYGYHFDSLDEFKNSTDIERCTGAFCYNWERPSYAYAHFDRRLSEAESVYEEFKGTPINSSSSEESSSGEESTELEALGLPAEWDLVGMQHLRSKLAEQQQDISLMSRDDLSTGEQYSVATVGENLRYLKEANLIDTARVAVVFVGLCLIFYAVMLLVAFLFDYSNSFLEISLVKFMTFGYLEYSDDELARGQRGKASSKRLICLVVILIVIGCLFISGGVLKTIMQIVMNIYDKIG